MADSTGSGRLDRIEAALELLIDDHVQFREEHKHLLTAQVILTDTMDKLGKRVDQLAAAQLKSETRIDHTDATLNALIAVVDDFIRRQKP